MPTLNVNIESWFAVLYDCEQDCLLTLDRPSEWMDRVGLVYLWAVINHILFLSKLDEVPEVFQSGYQKSARDMGVGFPSVNKESLLCFEASINVRKRKQDVFYISTPPRIKAFKGQVGERGLKFTFGCCD